jgi:hypothetical protein
VANADGKQWFGGANLHCLTGRLNIYRRQFAVRIEVVERFAVPAPHRLCAAVFRDLVFGSRMRKAREIDLRSPGLARLLGEPVVGAGLESSVAQVVPRFQHPKRLEAGRERKTFHLAVSEVARFGLII